jgi:hypothetical protein
MLQMLPNWYFGFLPESLWPNRPREFYIVSLDLLPVPAGATVTKEVVFSKKTDVVVFGGSLLRTTAAGDSSFNPRSGTFVRYLCHMFNSSADETYTPLDIDGTPVVPAENLFSTWNGPVGNAGFVNMMAKQNVFWPQPIVILKGGALSLTLEDMAATASHVRVSFMAGLFYKREEAVAA